MTWRQSWRRHVKARTACAIGFCKTHAHTVFDCRVVLVFAVALIVLQILVTGIFVFWSYRSLAAPDQYTFDTSSGFAFDAQSIEITGGVARLKTIDQTDDDNTSTGFAGGTHSGTTYTSALTKSVADTSNANFTSRIIDIATSTSWSTFTWTPAAPYLKNLPNNRGIETAYATNNADMTGNLLLSHFNESAGATSFADNSGNAWIGSCTAPTCPTAGATGRFSSAASFDGSNDTISFGDVTTTEGISDLTVEAWVNLGAASRSNRFMPIVEKWMTSSTMATSSFATFDLTSIDASLKGFQGSIFDGRYIYFAPGFNTDYFGKLTRYDTRGSFVSAGSYAFFDMTAISPSSTGLNGAVFDGRYIYLYPFMNNPSGSVVFSGQITRYDTQGSFTDTASYAVFDTKSIDADSQGFSAAAYDGRYVYFVPGTSGTVSSPIRTGKITRYDTQGSFTDSVSYTTFDVGAVNGNSLGFSGAIFDGRYLYLNPGLANTTRYTDLFTRYDTQGSFSSAGSYAFSDMTLVHGSSTALAGGVFDGRYIYLPPSNALTGSNTLNTIGNLFLRYDTQGSFSDTGSYSYFDLVSLNHGFKGFSRAVFDGRYVYLIPFGNSSADVLGFIVRYDTLSGFTDPASYTSYNPTGDSMSFHRFGGGVFDGRFIYFVPSILNVATRNGTIVRYDTTAGDSSFALRVAYQGDGKSGAALPGLTAMIQTSAGTFSVSDWSMNRAANTWHHVAMTYDGSTLSLYVNGSLVKSTSASGTITDSTAPLTIGSFNSGNSKTYNGLVDEVALYNRSLSAGEILARYRRGATRLKFQVRSCDDVACSGETFQGPDGTADTYYSELQNSTTGTPSLAMTSVATNRAFQYKAFLETDDASSLPQCTNVSIGPTHYAGNQPTIQPNAGVRFTAVQGFSDALGANNQGSVRYQFSLDQTNWYYWTGAAWALASSSANTNPASEVSTPLALFPSQVGTGNLWWKAFLFSTSGTQLAALDTVDLSIQNSAPSGGMGGGTNQAPIAIPVPTASIRINGGALTTTSTLISLTILPDASSTPIAFTLLSDTSTFDGSSLEPFQATHAWNLCPRTSASSTCREGTYTFFARIYSSFGTSNVVTSTIRYLTSLTSVPAAPTSALSVSTSTPPAIPAQATTTAIATASTALPEIPATPSTSSLPLAAVSTFLSSWSRGMWGLEVKLLQQFLNARDFKLASTGHGSPGEETEYFGPRTQAALALFQKFHVQEIFGARWVASELGIFGPRTRKYVNNLLRDSF